MRRLGLRVLLLLPHLTLGSSPVPYATWTHADAAPVLSLVNYQRLFGESERLRPLLNSLWMAAASTVGALVLALAAGWLVVRRRVAMRRLIESLLALPWALPGTVFAIALATTFSVSRPLALRWVLVGTVLILPLAYLVRNLPIAGRAVLAGYRQLDPSLEEAAASLGAGRWTTLGRVTLPLLQPALAAGRVSRSSRRSAISSHPSCSTPHNTRPIAMEILSSLRLNELGIAAAFGVVLMVASAAVLGLGARR